MYPKIERFSGCGCLPTCESYLRVIIIFLNMGLLQTDRSQDDMKATNPFIEDAAIAWEPVDPLIRRKVMGYDRQLMMVRVEFLKGGIGTLHQHPHSQITHIESGVFDVSIGGESRRLRAGDAYYIPPDVVHGAVCIEDGTLVDVFSPMREDLV